MVVKKREEDDEVGVSLSPDDAEEGKGGLMGNMVATVKKAECVNWTYAGTREPSPALMLMLEPEEEGELTQDQYWSAGSPLDWKVSKDGEKFVPLKGQKGLRKNSNAMLLLDSFIDAGFDKELLAKGKVSVLEGLKCFWKRENAPVREGLDNTKEGKDGKKYPKTVLLVGEIITEKGGKGKTADKGKGDDELTEKAQEAVMAVLEDYPKGIEKRKLAQEVFKKLKEMDVDIKGRNVILQMVVDDGFHGSAPWGFDPKKGMVGV